MIPERSIIGKSAKSVFFEDVNDIDIYIEDTAFGYEKLFSLLFSRVFENKYKVEKVFSLGGRKAVIEQYKSQKNSIIRPSLFVIDGDLFILTGDSEQNQKGLYKFPFYCVENILIDHVAIHNLLDDEEPVKSKDNLIEELNFTDWIKQNELKLFWLFVEYAITFKVNPEEVTVAYEVKKLVSSNNGYIDETKLENRIKYLRDMSVAKVGIEGYQKNKNLVLINFENSSVNKLDVVSGKDYLFPLIKTRFKSVVKTQMPDINFKLRLAKTCNIERIKECISHVLYVE